MSKEEAKFIVYKSSAGSGKTFTLVREYLKLVIADPEQFRRILAITFTNKASNEMKERVIRYLTALSDLQSHAQSDAVRFLLPQLREQLGMDEREISRRANLALRLILHHYADFAISTIDSFTHRVIRTFAHDLKVPVNFEVELDAAGMLSQAVDSLISLAGSDATITRLLVDFTETKASEEKNWNIESDLNQFGRTLIGEDGVGFTNRLAKYHIDDFLQARRQMNARKQEFEREIKVITEEILTAVDKAGLTTADFSGKTRGFISYLKKIASGNFDKIIPSATARKPLESGQWLGPKPTAGAQAAFSGIADTVVPSGKDLLELVDSRSGDYFLIRLLLRHLFSCALLGELEKTLSALSFEDNKLLISEFNRRISEVVRNQPAPFIYERLGEKYLHYLLDEFQDTSVMQWHNLLPLIENSLASNRMNLLVGDAKQAIYRWRSGDAEQFENLPDLMHTDDDPVLLDRQNTLRYQYREERLDSNHRSGPVIVEWNNRLFSLLAPALPADYASGYLQVAQKVVRTERKSLVRIETASDERRDEQYLQDVFGRISAILDEVKADGYRLSDVAILCRDNRRAGKIASFLTAGGIPVISGESLLLTQSQRVRFLIAWIQHVASPTEPLPFAHILQFFSSHGLIPQDKVEDIFSKAWQPGSYAHSHSILRQGLMAVLSKIYPGFNYDHLQVLDMFGLVQYLVVHLLPGSAGDSYLSFFRDAVLRYLKTKNGSPSEFLEWWERESERSSVIIPEGINAVRIMTIHKSKGLQFPVVIYPFADEEIRIHGLKKWVEVEKDYYYPLDVAYLPVSSELEKTEFSWLYQQEMSRLQIDMVNLLYVALTRPEERLYVITGKLPAQTDKLNSVPKMLSFGLQAMGLWEAGKAEYLFGERWSVERDQFVTSDDRVPSEGDLPGRASLRLLLRRHAPGGWDLKHPASDREWGNLVHELLSRAITEDDLIKGPAEIALPDWLNDEGREELKMIMRALADHQEVRSFFAPGYDVRNEPEIITLEGKSFRPDRVMIRDGRALIMDYKTGSARPWHRDQVMEYARLLGEMGYQVGGAYLVYVNRSPEVIRLI